MRIADVTRAEIEAFMEREWSVEQRARFGDENLVKWEWREFAIAAFDRDEIVGSAIFRTRGGVAHLSNVISSATRRRQGIGGALVDAFEKRARELGCHKLTLVTYLEDRSTRFYERHGFTIEAVLRDDAFHMDRCQMFKFVNLK